MKSKGLFLCGEATGSHVRAALSRVYSKDIPRGQGCRFIWENGRGGAKFASRSFVHAARKPKPGFFVRCGAYDRSEGAFQGKESPYPANGEESALKPCRLGSRALEP
jgi:hypothetical protein